MEFRKHWLPGILLFFFSTVNSIIFIQTTKYSQSKFSDYFPRRLSPTLEHNDLFFISISSENEKPIVFFFVEKIVYVSTACNHSKILPHSFWYQGCSYLVKQLKAIQYICISTKKKKWKYISSFLKSILRCNLQSISRNSVYVSLCIEW